MPALDGGPDDWVRVDDASRYGRGGLLPMAVFLTKNAPGLRTSPVKRGYWVVRRLLGEHIPAAAAERARAARGRGEAGRPDAAARLLARHRDDTSCAGCHERFDSIGLVFEGYGPIGERRDEGPRRPAGRHHGDVPRRQRRDRARRPAALPPRAPAGRFPRQPVPQAASLRPGPHACCSRTSRRSTRCETKLAADDYRFGSLVETIVTSPQFLNKRGDDGSRAK